MSLIQGISLVSSHGALSTFASCHAKTCHSADRPNPALHLLPSRRGESGLPLRHAAGRAAQHGAQCRHGAAVHPLFGPPPDQQRAVLELQIHPAEGFDYNNFDGTISRRDSSKIIKVDGTYYVYYTKRETAVPPAAAHGPNRGTEGATDTIPSRDWDLAEIWYATSKDGFTWEEQGVAVPNPPKPQAGWRSVSTPDILVWDGKYYLYYQAYTDIPGQRGGDYCPVSASVSDSPGGPFKPANKIVLENGPPGSWDQFVIHDPTRWSTRARSISTTRVRWAVTPRIGPWDWPSRTTRSDRSKNTL